MAEASASNTAQQRGYLYNYNPNKWLTQSSFGTVNGNAITPATAFKEGNITYDKNGNILSLQRAKEDGTVIDNFTYNYDKGNNQLTHVDDAVVGNADLQDLKDQNTNNYGYDVLGRMTENVAEGIQYYYNTQGLVNKITRGSQLTVTFKYNERGHRISKEVNRNNGGMVETEYYVVDLGGNAMALYYKLSGTAVRPSIALHQKENPIFGISRLGVYTRGVIVDSKLTSAKTSYEITDHLGNVRAVIQENPNVFSILLSYADYYAFGEQLPSRNTTSDYRYAFQGQELDKATGMEAFQLRLWDGRIGRWLSPDPYRQYDSPYLGMGNNPITGIDPDGGFWQELGNWVSGSGWNSNAALAYQANGGTLGEWHGNKFTGHREASSIGNDGDVSKGQLSTISFTKFKAVQDYGFGSSSGGGFDFLSSFQAFNRAKTLNFKANIGFDLLKFKGYHYGVAEFETSLLDGRGAVTPGNFVLYPTGGSSKPYYSNHEPGHVLQYRILGPVLYYAVIAIPSVANTKLHSNFLDYTEKSANTLRYIQTGETDDSNKRYFFDK